ncbi:phosphotransferase family protein [Knoellia sp. p5-6-4]|uniref:phosphotransferase family protein n=1 Tax=unclassified Knoellia TaxID=2618719 RepID=UPI0023DA4F91|nr:phosphotransferase [Knoellia sp. p5-6-4]MDF2144316.1 phosphotransferase [Knoellia sp. p5-6-4]
MNTGSLAAAARLEAAAGPLGLRRAWPRPDGSLHLEYVDARGHTVAAQLLPDRARAETVVTAAGRGAELHPAQPVVLHWSGADGRLGALPGLVRRGARVVSHRPERRAVVQRPDGAYAKVVRPGTSSRLVATSERTRLAARRAFLVPRVLAHDLSAGVVTWEEVPGPTLLQVGRSAPGLADLVQAWTAAGRAVADLHRHDATDLPVHDARDEVRTTEGWVESAVAWGLLPAAADPAAYRLLLAGPPGPVGVLHRDLHDKQVVLARDGVGVLDLDTLAVGERALDLGNVLAHLELRVAQGLLGERAAQVAGAAFLAGAAPDADTLRRVPAYQQVARLRLAGVYAFRPGWNALARRWWASATSPR